METLSEVKTGLLKDKATRDAYTVLEDEFSIAHELIGPPEGQTDADRSRRAHGH